MKKIMCIFAFLFFLSFGSQCDAGISAADCENAKKIVILNYHKVDDVLHSLSVPPSDFDDQMAYLKDQGFQTISLEQMRKALAGEQVDLPEKPLVITFDDGYRDNYTNAYPILAKYGFTGVIFVITSFLDRKIPQYLTWDMAKEMQDSGVIDIESHTVNHNSMTELSDEKLRTELVDSKKRIEEILGKSPEYIAYPTGTYNLHIAGIVRECGYKGAFTIKYGNVDAMTNLYAIERLPVFRTAMTYEDFVDRLQYVPTFERFGWIKS
ncbi:MAG: polysaccharide deacetylase family protein [Selenomonadaceae bacterium]|nr:polysaccharide deacetylase family protein [Selenomonadaceae bacterium]